MRVRRRVPPLLVTKSRRSSNGVYGHSLAPRRTPCSGSGWPVLGAECSDHPYDRVRYERILELVTENYYEMLDVPAEEAHDRLTQTPDIEF